MDISIWIQLRITRNDDVEPSVYIWTFRLARPFLVGINKGLHYRTRKYLRGSSGIPKERSFFVEFISKIHTTLRENATGACTCMYRVLVKKKRKIERQRERERVKMTMRDTVEEEQNGENRKIGTREQTHKQSEMGRQSDTTKDYILQTERDRVAYAFYLFLGEYIIYPEKGPRPWEFGHPTRKGSPPRRRRHTY